ncbi:four helix bundle protein [Arenibacter algicola]|jgi:four helix bundle protein|uniref:Four helix bundle protein n=1 Tax=Arenibacter algicola TaxID=616991 RepID=A0A221UQZ4_9FLAO|nr:four helix bundle protein [Arenibacter algicola]ASO03774.1 four helix bundle protein [Arenibacter algicola]HCO82329.1 four helix bundle protein [Arenibacter sp.]|tara:strand:+ start:17742 stop:18143 length:402 start_codon:yes stop_codon:yes gene_type:complete
MAKVERFEDLEIWQLAREICNKVHQIFETTSLGDNYALRNQMDKSSGSIMDNISEGFERNGNREFIQFLSIAKASCGELRSQLYRVLDRNHIDKASFEALYEMVLLESKKISSFINYLSRSEYKGSKFNKQQP